MTLARRIRELRYLKGWGPDDLARHAAVSRTALYQIECGRTHAPRAGTLLKIARALELPVERLLDESGPESQVAVEARMIEAMPIEGVPDRERLGALDRMFRELLASHLGEGLARLVEDSHRLLPERHTRQTG